MPVQVENGWAFQRQSGGVFSTASADKIGVETMNLTIVGDGVKTLNLAAICGTSRHGWQGKGEEKVDCNLEHGDVVYAVFRRRRSRIDML